MSLQHTNAKKVVVLGAGVVGLTVALTIQEKGGYDVTIIADTFPSDPNNAKYASHWAGAWHAIYKGTREPERQIQRDTFKVMWDLSEPGSEAEGCFRRIKTREYYYEKTDIDASWMPDFQPLPINSLVPPTKSGYTYSTYTVDPPLYLNYLLARFLARGGVIVRGTVLHISQVIEGGPDVFARGHASPAPIDALVVCSGIGARTLGGVEDTEVIPSRGQVVTLRAPWVSEGKRVTDASGTMITYVIPHRKGTVALGSTKDQNDWYPVPRPKTTEDILQRCLGLMPELAPPEIARERKATVDDLRPLIVEVGVGLRPARKGGIRLDMEWVDDKDHGRKIPVVYNYGHDGSGFVFSWGCATRILNMLEDALSK
ncbi:D-amino-acid oxidase [Laetiporus sulphureus 93-53]|uniref:D-amino-acid oxidase n=1 Tax=Laetiporus sulphureus 93-53 TaxID=1314785 RepID=A0A165EZC6_9APHY|nr:D-amino-acid oxidase [Laetiporus sulphureus 93-53]KZT08034.1 D-amino-acid oxidase [Laetiporus sulphureus 93-53]